MRNKRLIVIFSILLSVTLIVLLSSIIFSVKSVVADCYNYTAFSDQADSDALNKAVVENAQLKGKSIFLIDDKTAISHIESKVPSIKIINIERIFPSTTRINYVKMFSYFQTKISNTYYDFLCNGRIVSVSQTQSANRINIIANLSGVYNVNDYILDDFLSDIATAFERLNLANENAVQFFDFIDLSKNDGAVYVGIRNSNTVFKIYGKNRFFEHLHLAYSFYCNEAYNPVTDTMIVVANNNGFYSSDRYLP